MLRKALIALKGMMKFVILIAIGIMLIVSLIIYLYKPIYSVSYNGEAIGYSENKAELQKRINEYMETGDGNGNLAYVQINEFPEYEMCLLKKGIPTNDDEIFDIVTNTGIAYYNYFSLCVDEEEKYYFSTFGEAETTINTLKEKKSRNIDSLSIDEKYTTDLPEFASVDNVVEALFVEPPKPVVTVKPQYTQTEGFSTSYATSNQYVALTNNFIKPVSGTITSRFGRRSGGTHTGLDIANSTGTPIKAAATGTVIYSGYKGSYGRLIIIAHTDSIQTYYAHCSRLYATAGQTVSQGEVIAAVGSTGNSTGPHLHLEVRVNGVAKNPQNYVYGR